MFAVRGNVDTRLRKLSSGEFDAMVLAAAGLGRLGRTEMVRETIAPEMMCPAAGQGALAIEIRAGDKAIREQVSFLEDSQTRSEVTCERALLRALGGGCQVPIGAFAQQQGSALRLMAIVARPDGTKILRESQTGDSSDNLGKVVGESLLQQGAEAILREVEASTVAANQQP